MGVEMLLGLMQIVCVRMGAIMHSQRAVIYWLAYNSIEKHCLWLVYTCMLNHCRCLIQVYSDLNCYPCSKLPCLVIYFFFFFFERDILEEFASIFTNFHLS